VGHWLIGRARSLVVANGGGQVTSRRFTLVHCQMTLAARPSHPGSRFEYAQTVRNVSIPAHQPPGMNTRCRWSQADGSMSNGPAVGVDIDIQLSAEKPRRLN
jgi:hypothetical protein